MFTIILHVSILCTLKTQYPAGEYLMVYTVLSYLHISSPDSISLRKQENIPWIFTCYQYTLYHVWAMLQLYMCVCWPFLNPIRLCVRSTLLLMAVAFPCQTQQCRQTAETQQPSVGIRQSIRKWTLTDLIVTIPLLSVQSKTLPLSWLVTSLSASGHLSTQAVRQTNHSLSRLPHATKFTPSLMAPTTAMQ